MVNPSARSACEAVVNIKDQAADKLHEVKEWTKELVRDPNQTLSDVKQSMVEGTRTAGAKIEDVKDWTAEKAKKVNDFLDRGQEFLSKLSEKIDQLKDWTEGKARAASEGLGLAKEVVAKTGRLLEDRAGDLSLEIKSRSAAAQAEIDKLEGQLQSREHQLPREPAERKEGP